MAYDIRKTNGTSLGTILDGTVDNKSKTSLVLLGRNYANYGQFMVDNTVSLIENFANSISPSNPLAGQLWWNTADGRLRVYTGSIYKQLASLVTQINPPTTTVSGDVWWDNSNQQLYVYNGTSPFSAAGWILIGPGYSEINGKSGAIWERITDTTLLVHNVLSLYLDGVRTAIISRDSEFTPQVAIAGYTTIKQGLTANTGVNNAQYFVTANNANFLDNIDSSQFLRSDESDSTSGVLSITNNNGLTVGAGVGTGNLQLVTNSLGDAHIVGTKLNRNLIVFANVAGTSTNVISVEGVTGATTVRELVINQPTAATSTTTGALKVSGGVGIAGDVFIGGNLVADSITGNAAGTADMVRNIVPITLGGTAADTASQARTNLGLTIGVDVQPYNVNLQAVSSLGANGIYVKTANGTLVTRQLAAGTNITIDNATAIAGNPTISLVTSPALSGSPTAPTPSTNDDSTRIATTAWVKATLSPVFTNITPITLGGTGATTAPQARTNLGLTIGVDVQPYNVNLQAVSSLGSNGIYVKTANGTLVTRQLTAGTNITIDNATAIAGNPTISLVTSPALSGSPTAPTPSTNDDSTRIATTEWVKATLSPVFTNIIPINLGGTGATTATQARTNLGLTIGVDVQPYNVNLQAVSSLGANGFYVRTSNGVLVARQFDAGTNIAISNPSGASGNPSISLVGSPALTGSPTAPTPPTNDNSTRIATTAWVRATQAPEPIWAGTTSFTNVRNTYVGAPNGTKVAFIDTRTYSIGVGNGAATISDRFRRVVKKIDALTWIDVGG